MGDIVQGLSARQVAMGGTGVAATEDAAALFVNPARLSTIERYHFNFVAAPSAYSTYEKATHADASKSFDENSVTYPDFPMLAAAYSFEKWTLAVGWANLFDFRYFFDAETFSQGKLSTEKRAEDFGEIRALVGSASYRFERFSLGLSYLSYRGTPSFSFHNFAFNPQTGAVVSSTELNSDKLFGGSQMMGGMAFHYSEKLILAAALKGRFTMSETEKKKQDGVESKTEREWKMPYQLGLGVTYKFSEKGSKPTLAFDAIKTWWGNTTVSVDGGEAQPVSLTDTLSYHIGMEHYLTPEIPLRYGLSLIPFYGRQEADTFGISLGSGYIWHVGRHTIAFDISGEYKLRSTPNTTRLFPEPEDPAFPFINQDVVDSYVKRFIATISYKF